MNRELTVLTIFSPVSTFIYLQAVEINFTI